MSVLYPVGGVLQPPKSMVLTGGTDDVLTFAAASPFTATIIGIIVVNNNDTNAREVKLYWHDGATAWQFYDKSIAANDCDKECLLEPLVLYPKVTAKKIQAAASAATDCTITVAYTLSQQAGNAG